MGVESGGRASKLGHEYERAYATQFALYLLNGRVTSLCCEPSGDDEPGVDLWVTDDKQNRIAHQLKRQEGRSGSWSVTKLRKVLLKAQYQLEREETYRFVFISSSPAPDLGDLAERASRHNDTPQSFLSDHVNSSDARRRAFEGLLEIWGLDPSRDSDIAKAIQFLKRLSFGVFPLPAMARYHMEPLAALQVDADPATVISVLETFLDEHMGCTIYADALRAHLAKRGFTLRNLGGDPFLPAALDRLRKNFDSTVRQMLIDHRSLPRKETQEILQHLLDDEPPRIIFVHGGAGCGKTVVLHQVFSALQDHGIPTLPLQLHITRPTGSPNAFGKSPGVGLPASPTTSLRAIAGDRHAVFVLDQMDALRHTSTHSQEAWTAYSELVDEILSDSRTTVITACRSFDLENDPLISRWRRDLEHTKKTCVLIKIGDLSDDQVAEVLRRYEITFSSLSIRQQNLLKRPNALALWCRLAERGTVLCDINNLTQLMKSYVRQCRRAVEREYSVSATDIDHVLSTLIQFLDGQGRLDAPTYLLANHTATVDAFCSTGLLTRRGDVLAFAHQSYLDYLLAERVLRESLAGGQKPACWIKDNQSLYRRDQLRQLLTLLRDCDLRQHRSLLRGIFSSPQIRFHLKKLVLDLLRHAEPVLDYEAELLVELSEQPEWRDHVSDVIWCRAPWFDALNDMGIVSQWLEGRFGESWREFTLRFLRSIVETRGEQIDELLSPYWNAGTEWQTRLLSVLPLDASGDSPKMAELRLRNVQSGVLSFEGAFAEKLAERAPKRLVDLIEADVSAWLKHVREHVKTPGVGSVQQWRTHDRYLTQPMLNAVRQNAEIALATLTRLLLDVAKLEHVCCRTADEHGSFETISGKDIADLQEAPSLVERLWLASLEGVAETTPSIVSEAVDSVECLLSERMERLIARGLAAGGPPLADYAINWLVSNEARLTIGDGYHETYWEPARKLISKFAPACSPANYSVLESAILSYKDERERRSVRRQLRAFREGVHYSNDWGLTQHMLLDVLPTNRRSCTASTRATTWSRKFGSASKQHPSRSHVRGGTVTSPIPRSRLHELSDKTWLEIITSDLPHGSAAPWRQLDNGHVGEASVREFADDLGLATQAAPSRFAALALRMPQEADLAYFLAILRNLVFSRRDANQADWRPASVIEIERIIHHVGRRPEREYVETVCSAIRNRSEGRWSDQTIAIVSSYADDPHPAKDEYTVCHTDRDGKKVPDVILTGENCIRGAVASAIASLLWSREDAYEILLPTARKLMADPHPSVRCEAIAGCMAIWKRDRDLAVELFVRACTQDDTSVLNSGWVNQFIRRSRQTHLSAVLPVIRRMIQSEEDKTVRAGAVWATACWIDTGEVAELVSACRSGSCMQRCGVADAVAEYFASVDEAEKCSQLLCALFDDAEPEVRSAATGVFGYADCLETAECPQLASAFVHSRAFLDEPYRFLFPLAESRGDIMRYSQAILDASDVISEALASETGDFRHRTALAGDKISALLLRLYDASYQAENITVREECLTRWDNMLKNRVYITEQQLLAMEDAAQESPNLD